MNASSNLLLSPDAIATDQEIGRLVRVFYGRARADSVLGPVFERHVTDWDRHFLILADFWSSVLNTSGRYKGQPMLVHMKLPELKEEHFAVWLDLFKSAAAETLSPAAAEIAVFKASRIAESMRLGLRQTRGLPLF